MRKSIGFIFVSSSLASAWRRVALIDVGVKMRDEKEIREGQCDLEQAIQIPKYLFGLQDRLRMTGRLAFSIERFQFLLPSEDH